MIPPFAVIVSVIFRNLVLTVVVSIEIVVKPSTTFSVFPVGMVKPPFAVINPEILAEPTTSSATVGDALPIPRRDLAPPIKYMLLVALALVPYWAIGAVNSVLTSIKFEVIVVCPSMLTSPMTSSLDLGAELPIPVLPDCNIQKSMRLEVLLSILKVPSLFIRFQLL
jgi:hypothetical protein